VQQLKDMSAEKVSSRAGVAEWVALGAVISGSVGALVGAARCAARSSRQHRVRVSDMPDPSTVTAPHGDKLHVAW
jgi:hypothetical protein